MIGYPEARIPLSQLVIYLACSPKSNRAISIIDNEIQKVKSGFAPVVPEYLKDAHYAGAKELGRGMGYKYPHDFGGFVDQEYMSTKVDAIAVGVQGFEKTLDEWLHKIRGS
jgi:putative ATPase